MLVRRLDFGDLVNMLEADGAHEVVPWASSALLYAGCLLEEVGGRRCFRDEGKRPVRLDGNQSGNGNARLDVRRASIEFLAEIHRLYAASTESWPDGWRRSRFASRDEEPLENGGKHRHREVRPGTHDDLGFSIKRRFRHGQGRTENGDQAETREQQRTENRRSPSESWQPLRERIPRRLCSDPRAHPRLGFAGTAERYVMIAAASPPASGQLAVGPRPRRRRCALSCCHLVLCYARFGLLTRHEVPCPARSCLCRCRDSFVAL